MTEEKEKSHVLNLELLKKFSKLEKAKAALSAALDRVNAKLDPIRDTVTDQLIDSGINRIEVNNRTIYVRHDIWAKLLSTRVEAIKALKDAELDEYVAENFNMNSLSAYVREKIKNGEKLPESFDGVIDASHVYKARSNKS